jgi:hypothetical protein
MGEERTPNEALNKALKMKAARTMVEQPSKLRLVRARALVETDQGGTPQDLVTCLLTVWASAVLKGSTHRNILRRDVREEVDGDQRKESQTDDNKKALMLSHPPLMSHSAPRQSLKILFKTEESHDVKNIHLSTYSYVSLLM